MPLQLAEQIASAARRLQSVSDTPRLDAELLFAHTLNMPRSQLLAMLHKPLEAQGVESLILRRLNYEPIAYITGTWEFFGLELAVHPPILVPRPETEHLVETAIKFLAECAVPNPRMLDLCTGTGCVAIAVGVGTRRKRNLGDANGCAAEIVAADINPDAAALAKRNAAAHALDLSVYTGDLYDALPPGATPFDVITCNPPYVSEMEWGVLSPVITKHEDPRAVVSGADGLDCMRRVVAGAPRWLMPGGMLAVEMDSFQREAVESLFHAAGFVKVHAINDLSGRPRVVAGEKNE